MFVSIINMFCCCCWCFFDHNNNNNKILIFIFVANFSSLQHLFISITNSMIMILWPHLILLFWSVDNLDKKLLTNQITKIVTLAKRMNEFFLLLQHWNSIMIIMNHFVTGNHHYHYFYQEQKNRSFGNNSKWIWLKAFCFFGK